MLLKLIMSGVKTVVGFIPVSVKSKLKTTPFLFDFYRRALHRSGLFYGVPSPKKMAKIYSRYITEQAISPVKTNVDKLAVPTLFVLAKSFVVKDIIRTLQSIECMSTKPYKVVICGVGLVIDSKFVQTVKQQFPSVIFYAESNLDLLLEHNIDLADRPGLFVRAGDQLYIDTLDYFSVADPSCVLGYCDTDLITETGQRHTPYFKPCWNPMLHCSTEYVDTGLWVRELQLVVDYCDLSQTISSWLIKAYLQEPTLKVTHIDSVLVHLRSFDFAVKANDNLFGESAAVKHEHVGVRSILWKHDSPKVTLIIPTYNGKDLVEACINSILQLTSYTNYEILLIDNNSDDAQAIAYFKELDAHPKIRLLSYPHAFNYSAINNFAVEQASGQYVALVNNDIEVIDGHWLGYMVGHASKESVGCVGAKLLYSDRRVQHAGVVMGYGGGAGHAHKYYPDNHSGYMNRLQASQNYSAVTAACLLIEKSVYEAVGGLNEQDLTVAFNDVDFCLKVDQLGYRNVYCAEAVLYHHESISRGHEDTPEKLARFESELTYLRDKWRSVIIHDPAYSRHLTLSRENFALRDKQ